MPKISSFVARVVVPLVCALCASIAYSQAIPTLCRFTSATGIAFGIYQDGASIPKDTTSSVTINCARNSGPQNLNLTVAIGPSATSGTIGTRSLREGSGAIITYNLYRDSSRSLIWGQTAGVDTVTQALSIPNNSSASSTFTIFGRIPALQNARVGTYSDSVVATVYY